MTTWRAGMKAAVVRNDWCYGDGRDVANPPEIGDVFLVRSVQRRRPDTGSLLRRTFGKKEEFLNISGFGWVASDLFRPVDDSGTDAELVARIKACRPARKPAVA